jgi:hypothetical protein
MMDCGTFEEDDPVTRETLVLPWEIRGDGDPVKFPRRAACMLGARAAGSEQAPHQGKARRGKTGAGVE